jgi:hypothetical protein
VQQSSRLGAISSIARKTHMYPRVDLERDAEASVNCENGLRGPSK